MASWVDVFSLVATLSLMSGTVYGLLSLAHQCHAAVASARESLNRKGIRVSEHGISVAISRHGRTPEECMDALVELLHHNPKRRRALSDAMRPMLPAPSRPLARAVSAPQFRQ
ncbi:hypothetical protein CERSUDRAFT_100266 [Gelatoporia subvermispora B]|uniref:Uncharacterized protein n=1 Tax=Ceriporiopsis subvermispora (strain B) TaxID=914234 RepID=M2R019_CERS8|nr:hypothetical protein CERSUDRAFT_100266 [Gelatoporia subvermispora B]